MLYKNIYLSDGSCLKAKSNFYVNKVYTKDYKNTKNWNINKSITTTNFIESFKNKLLKRK
jgi:hypothetical protein